MAELVAKEVHDLPDSISERMEHRQQKIMEAEERLNKERQHMKDIYDTAAELLGVEEPPQRTRFDSDNGVIIELAPKSEIENEDKENQDNEDIDQEEEEEQVKEETKEQEEETEEKEEEDNKLEDKEMKAEE